MSYSKQLNSDFTEDFVSFMIQMMLTIVRFPRAPFALIPMSKTQERILGADAMIESISPLYLQFKRSTGYPDHSTSKILKERANLALNNSPIVLYFELRDKDPTHSDYQHNVLLDLRRKLELAGSGNATYVAPLFLNRTSYLFAVHFSTLIHWRPWNLFTSHPFIEQDFQILSNSGIIRFHNCPVLHEHISIPPHIRVSSSKHRYSYLENGSQVCFHSPQKVSEVSSLGKFLYDFVNFKDGVPTTSMVTFQESGTLLNQLSNEIFETQYLRNQNGRFNLIDSWLAFGEDLKSTYNIDQYLLIKFKDPH